MRKLKNLLLVALVLLCVFLGLWTAQDNAGEVAVTLLGFEMPELSLGLWLLIMFAGGALLGILASWPLIIRHRAEAQRLRRSQ